MDTATATDSVDACLTDFASRYDAIDPRVEGVVDRIAKIEKHLSRAFEDTLAKHGLNHGEYKLLLRLATRTDDGRMSAGDLARLLLLSSGATTNRLDRLEEAGLIRRLRDPRDRRGVLVEMTDEGRARIDGAVTEQAAREISMLGALGHKELDELNLLLRKVLVSLEAEGADEAEKQAG